jgi:Zinc finger, C3HC4 type (RING finger)
MSIIFSERDIEVALRWSEVHAKKLFNHLYEDIALAPEYRYYYENKIAVKITTLKNDYRDEDTRVKVSCFLYPYESDSFFSIVLHHTSQIISLRELFIPHIGIKQICPCGRLGKTHLLESENGKCNNCYIYGFVRGEECSICKEDDGKPWLQTSCNHYFHDVCWYNISIYRNYVRKCPLCRSEQSSDTITKL